MDFARRTAISRTILAVLIIVVVAVAGAGAYAYYSLYQPKPSSPLIVFSADLYSAESSYLYSGFSNQTGIPYATPHAAGSTALAAQIAAGSPVSVFISVSKTALEQPALQGQYSGWGIAFAGDQMSIGYTNSTGQPAGFQTVLGDYQTASASNSSSDWSTFFSDLTSGSVKVGISNPNTDPAGYRAWIVLELAGKLYANNQSYFVSRMLQSHSNVTGASAAALVAPLQSGQIQFLFMYKSAAQSHNLTPFLLPRHINLGDSKLSSAYAVATYNTSTGVQKGGAILLFITVPKNSTQTDEAYQFVTYVVQHASTMANFGMVPLSTPKLYNSTALPSQIAALLSSGAVVGSGSI